LATCDQDNAADAAQVILDDMCRLYFGENNKNLKPNAQSSSTVIAAYADAMWPNNAATLFEGMDRLAAKAGNYSFLPIAISYDALIWDHARVGDHQSSQSVFDNSVDAMDHKRQRDLQIVENIWAGVLADWCESGEPNAAKRVKEMIKSLALMR
jgi:hypothetical protein